MDIPFQRALIVRGGALGDFLLTLPVLRSLREAAPAARIEVLAYPGIAELARQSGLVDAVRSIEYGPLAGFFTRGTILDPGLRDYFSSFDLVLSYLYDPDGIFAENLHAAGTKRFVAAPHRPDGTRHAIDQLAAPLAQIGIPMAGRSVLLAPETAAAVPDAPLVVIHPGSGSPAKNWPAAHWRDLISRLHEEHASWRFALIAGEADTGAIAPLRDLAADERADLWENLPLPELAARLTGASLYLGHDTGISHLAAATGTPSLLLFGPTDPAVWAPPHDHVRILRAPDGDLAALSAATVAAAAQRLAVAGRLAPAPESNETGRA